MTSSSRVSYVMVFQGINAACIGVARKILSWTLLATVAGDNGLVVVIAIITAGEGCGTEIKVGGE